MFGFAHLFAKLTLYARSVKSFGLHGCFCKKLLLKKNYIRKDMNIQIEIILLL